jgi:hypothetical protein
VEEKPPIQINFAGMEEGKITVKRKNEDEIEIAYSKNGHKRNGNKRYPPSAGKGPQWFENRKRSINFESHNWASTNGNWLHIKCRRCSKTPDELGFWKDGDDVGEPCYREFE